MHWISVYLYRDSSWQRHSCQWQFEILGFRRIVLSELEEIGAWKLINLLKNYVLIINKIKILWLIELKYPFQRFLFFLNVWFRFGLIYEIYSNWILYSVRFDYMLNFKSDIRFGLIIFSTLNRTMYTYLPLSISN